MIDKFIKISRVGKFTDYSASGDTTLRKVTLVFGENGRGKSTIAAILRSLQTGEGHHITERTTLNRTGTPEVHLLLEKGTLAKFANGKWDCDPAAIDIFDVNFVFDNVYVGNSIEHDHKKNLYKIIIGEKGVKLSLRVDELDEQIREANRKLSDAKAAVDKQIDGALKIDKFLALSKIDDIDVQIAAQETVIAAQKSAAAIALKAALSRLTIPPNPDLAILATTIEDVSAAAEKAVADHIAETLDATGEEWIAQGYDYLADKESCPFCGQDVKGNALIAAFKSHFNEAYAILKDDIARAAAGLKTTLGPSALLAVQKTISANDTLLEFWKRFLPLSLTDLTFTSIEVTWKEYHSQSDDHLRRKSAAPLEKIDINATLASAQSALDVLREQVTAYNTAVDAANAIIAAKKIATSTGDVPTEESKLSLLKNTGTRHTDECTALCAAYTLQKAAKSVLDAEKDIAKDALDLYANTIFATYQDKMNKLLAAFGAEFQITNTNRSYVGGKASSSYEILINSQPVPLGDNRTVPGQTCFRNTLSIGDRSALALAFFLVKIGHDPDIANKCVVFDDPVSSLDRFRMGCTVRQILDVAAKAKQVIVLCHDPYCLKQIFDHLPSGHVRALYLDRKGTDSVLLEWDIEQATRSQYFQDYFTLAKYVAEGASGADLRDFARKIRPLLEENLRVRFPDEFSTGWLGDFIDGIRKAAVRSPLAGLQAQMNELAEINDFSKQYHHSTNPSADSAPISDTELKTYSARTFAFIRGT